MIKQFKIRLQRWLQNSINTLKTAWLHTSKGSSVWYVKYIPIQLLCFKNGTRHYRFCEDSSRTNFSPTRKPPCPRLCTEGKGCRSGDRRSLCSLSADTVWSGPLQFQSCLTGPWPWAFPLCYISQRLRFGWTALNATFVAGYSTNKDLSFLRWHRAHTPKTGQGGCGVRGQEHTGSGSVCRPPNLAYVWKIPEQAGLYWPRWLQFYF